MLEQLCHVGMKMSTSHCIQLDSVEENFTNHIENFLLLKVKSPLYHAIYELSLPHDLKNYEPNAQITVLLELFTPFYSDCEDCQQEHKGDCPDHPLRVIMDSKVNPYWP